MKASETLIKKYNVPVPRYTSYPTVPNWDTEALSEEVWRKSVLKAFRDSNREKGISIYIHLPYCEKLCHYCACTKVITRNHKVEGPYMEAVKKEWDLYRQDFPEKPVIRELHLGGGTPTFFSPERLQEMIAYILKNAHVPEDHEFSFEGHPNTTTVAHLRALNEVGFNRISLGVQDFSEKVQKAINREQTFESVKALTEAARNNGYTSVNYDLIYGLPYQDKACVEHTVEKVGILQPDRLAFYSYAHVPWKEKVQRVFSEEDIPKDEEKRALYEAGYEGFLRLGYRDIGMDHFALPEDELFKALQEKRLHRNFMGFNTSRTELLIGLGMSAISDAKYAYAQNKKRNQDYMKSINAGNFAHHRGYKLSEEDLRIKRIILDLMCNYQLDWHADIRSLYDQKFENDLQNLEQDGLITWQNGKLVVTARGAPFIRNISAVFDNFLRSKQEKNTMFSTSI